MGDLQWIGGSLRFTGFFQQAPSLLSLQLWKQLCGEEPLIRNETPRMGAVHEEGPLGPMNLSIDLVSFRVDLVLGPLNAAPTNTPTVDNCSVPNIGIIESAYPLYFSLVGRLLKLPQMPILSRIALGAVYLYPVGTRSEGYKRIGDLLPFKPDPENSSELFYQINRPKKLLFNNKEIVINRLTKWSVAMYQFQQFPVPLDLMNNILPPGFSPGNILAPPPSFAVMIDQDINTAPEMNLNFDASASLSLLPQLKEYADEIAQKGDI